MQYYMSIYHGIIRNDSTIEKRIMRYGISQGIMKNDSAIGQGGMRYGIVIWV